ncbi:MAG: RHS repeat-associated core domain-containing protein [Acidimicrobiales bacterium]
MRLDHLGIEGSPEPVPASRARKGAGSMRLIRPGVWKLSVTAPPGADGSTRRVHQRIDEDVAVVHPTGVAGDAGGHANYDFDLADRLVSYTSPYRADASDTTDPTVAYTLDDGANITAATTTAGTQTRLSETSTYPGGRLASRSSTATPATGAAVSTATTFAYSTLGEETGRSTTVDAAPATTNTTGYDAAGHVAASTTDGTGVSYVYDGADHLLSRTQGGQTTLYFYWGTTTTLAEETDGAGAPAVRYVVDGADTIAQQRFTTTGSTWAWLLDDPAGNIGTQVSDTGAVLEQGAFDPYGAPESGGSSRALGAAGSSLGFQGSLTDAETKKVILGPRQYDPKTARFTNPDVYVGGAADVQLGADALTGNRYLFAGANPVAYYEDGHCALGKEATRRQVVDRRARRDMLKVADSSPAGYHYEFRDWTERVYANKSVCERAGLVGTIVDYGTGNDLSRSLVDSSYRNPFRSAERTVAAHGPLILNVASVGVGLFGIPFSGGASLAFTGMSLGITQTSTALGSKCPGRSSVFSLGTTAIGAATGQTAQMVLMDQGLRAASRVAGRGIGALSAVMNLINPPPCSKR